MKPSELRALSADELKQKELDLRRELFNLRFQVSKGELSNNMRIRDVRKDIAKVLTVMTEKERGIKNA
ncbi:MAG: 50S ribosomal protein L29 [Thermodesulfovibrionales bacterium]|nr:50S ribosomal protein L29 [Thermodesulfovibrionales bacterium]